MSNIKSPKQIKICFLGCGNITARHAKTIRKIDKNIGISFASRSIDKARQYCQRFSGELAFGSYSEAIQSDRNNVIMINTPPNSHLELASECVRSGKHIIVEKPPFIKSSDFDLIGPEADKKGLQLLVAENYFYKPLRERLIATLEEGGIGKPLFMNINAAKKQKSKNDWRDEKSMVSHGALYEGGIHWISLINNLGYTITKCTAFNPSPHHELDRSMQVTMETTEKMIINLFYSWEVDTIFQGLRLSKIFGTEGSITFESNGIFIIKRGSRKRLIFPGLSDIQGTKGMFQDFITSIKYDRPPRYNWEMAKNDLFLLEGAYNSLH